MSTTNKQFRLLGSDDLLTYYNLIPIYNKFVRPYGQPDQPRVLDQTLHPYIADLPGRNDFEPDGFLLNLLRDPHVPEHGTPIRPIDKDVLREAYVLKEGPIPGFDASVLGTDAGSTSSGGNTGQYPGEMAERDIYGTSAGEGDGSGERKHKKKKKKRKHSHDHDEDGHTPSEHKKKKKKKKESKNGIRTDMPMM